MAYHVFTESEVNKAVLKKAPLQIKSGKKSQHTTAWLICEKKKVRHLRVPNPHSKEFKQGKAGELAKKLYMNQEDYKLFIECTMSSKEYLVVLKKGVDAEEKEILAELAKAEVNLAKKS